MGVQMFFMSSQMLIRYTLILVYVVLLAVGASLVVYSLYSQTNPKTFKYHYNTKYNCARSNDRFYALEDTRSWFWLFLALFGIVLMPFGFHGIYAVVKMSRCSIKINAVIVLIVFFAFIGCGIWVMSLFKSYRNARRIVKDIFSRTFDETNTMETLFWKCYMLKKKCCGISSKYDFSDTPWGRRFQRYMPSSCCMHDRHDVMHPNCSHIRNSYADVGCLSKIKRSITSSGVLVLYCVVLLMLFFMAMSLLRLAYPGRLLCNYPIDSEPDRGSLASSNFVNPKGRRSKRVSFNLKANEIQFI